MELEGKVALVTGGAVRVGRAIALALAEAGCHLFIHYGRSAAPAESARAKAEALGVEVGTHQADLGDPVATSAVVEAAVERFGRLDILVNSAALFLAGDLAATTLESWDRQFAVNLRAPFLLSQAFAARISEPSRGKIVNVTDARIFRPAPDHFAYRLTKTGLWAMTRILARDLAPRITVNAVALGAILPPPGTGPEYLDELARREVPLRRPGSAESVAASVLYLLGEDFLTGVTLPLDGGQFL